MRQQFSLFHFLAVSDNIIEREDFVFSSDVLCGYCYILHFHQDADPPSVHRLCTVLRYFSTSFGVGRAWQSTAGRLVHSLHKKSRHRISVHIMARGSFMASILSSRPHLMAGA